MLALFVAKELDVQHSFQFVRNTHEVTFGLDKSLIQDFGPKDVSFQLPSLIHLKKINEIISKYEKTEDRFLNAIQNLKREYAMDILTNRRRIIHCYAGKVDGVIYSNGDVSLCEVIKPCENLRDFDFDFYELWNSGKVNEMREKIQRCCCIHPCHMLSAMRYDYNSLLKISLPRRSFY